MLGQNIVTEGPEASNIPETLLRGHFSTPQLPTDVQILPVAWQAHRITRAASGVKLEQCESCESPNQDVQDAFCHQSSLSDCEKWSLALTAQGGTPGTIHWPRADETRKGRTSNMGMMSMVRYLEVATEVPETVVFWVKICVCGVGWVEITRVL